MEHGAELQTVERHEVEMDEGSRIGLAALLVVHVYLVDRHIALIFQAERDVFQTGLVEVYVSLERGGRTVGIVHALIVGKGGATAEIIVTGSTHALAVVVQCHAEAHIQPFGDVEVTIVLHGQRVVVLVFRAGVVAFPVDDNAGVEVASLCSQCEVVLLEQFVAVHQISILVAIAVVAPLLDRAVVFVTADLAELVAHHQLGDR